MTKHIFTTILLGTLLTTGVVSAFQEPSASFPNGNASAPVNTGGTEQKKSGPFWAQYLKAGLLPLSTSFGAANLLAGFIIGDKVALAPQGFFTQVFLPGQESQLRVGSNGSDSLYNATFSNRAPVTVDLAGRGTSASDPKGREALALLADGGFCQTSTTIVTNTPAIQLYSDKNREPADLLARQIQLKGGSPGKDKVLISTDSQGNAVWGTLKVVNGAIQFDFDTSPVAQDQIACGGIITPPPVNRYGEIIVKICRTAPLGVSYNPGDYDGVKNCTTTTQYLYPDDLRILVANATSTDPQIQCRIENAADYILAPKERIVTSGGTCTSYKNSTQGNEGENITYTYRKY